MNDAITSSASYVPVLFLMLIAAVIAVVIPVLSSFLGQSRPDSVKTAPYECGVADLDSTRKRTYVRFYLTALTFVVFDIEIAFLYPWAVVLRRFEPRAYVFLAMMVFLSVILIAYAWEWKKGALDWD